jgi:hypothetical protein
MVFTIWDLFGLGFVLTSKSLVVQIYRYLEIL